jgi:hypothetical protein
MQDARHGGRASIVAATVREPQRRFQIREKRGAKS